MVYIPNNCTYSIHAGFFRLNLCLGSNELGMQTLQLAFEFVYCRFEQRQLFLLIRLRDTECQTNMMPCVINSLTNCACKLSSTAFAFSKADLWRSRLFFNAASCSFNPKFSRETAKNLCSALAFYIPRQSISSAHSCGSRPTANSPP